MQQEKKKNKQKSTNISQVSGKSNLGAKIPKNSAAASCSKTSSPKKQEQTKPNLRVAVYVLNQRGEALMPTFPQKARILLKEGRAKVIKRMPFTIQLTSASGESKQKIELGVDSGYLHVGLSAVSSKDELYSAEVKLRSNIVKLNSKRRELRRSRRHRKVWHRKARFLNRGNKKKGWLAPSIQHKLDSHLKLIKKVQALLPITHVTIEVAAFDIQKIRNPEIRGVEYQKGPHSEFWNLREYVLYRDHHKCCHCKGKSKDPILNVHHLESRQTGGDRPENLVCLCKTCHQEFHQGKIHLKVRKSKGFRAETFMTIVRWRLVEKLKKSGISVSHSYGYITKSRRIEQKLAKSHQNDAFVIVDGKKQRRLRNNYQILQVRKSNRKLFRGARSHIKNAAPRFIKGFKRFDKVLWQGIECIIFGRRKTGYFDLRTLAGKRIHASAKAKDCKLLESATTFIIERRTAIRLCVGSDQDRLLILKD